jgi:hypothetical protein
MATPTTRPWTSTTASSIWFRCGIPHSPTLAHAFDEIASLELVTRTNPSPPIEPDWKAVVMDMAEFLGALEGSPHLGIQTQLNAREIYRKMDSLIKKHVEDKTTERCITKHTGAKEE